VSIKNEQAKSLWENARDSIRHSLEHFSEECLSNTDRYHHKKWVILSVHHAAETFSYMLLKEFDENNSAFYKKGKHYYPGLSKTVKALLHPNIRYQLTQAEQKLLKLFQKLDTPRNKIIHGEIPQNLDISIMAMTIIGISRIAKKRCDESADDIVQQYPSIQKDVVEAIRWNKIDEYTQFIEAFVKEDNPNQYIQECPNCGAYAIIYNYCEACFEEVEEKICPNCHEEIILISSYPFEQHCSVCGEKFEHHERLTNA